MEVTVDWNIPAWGVFLAAAGFVGSIVKIYFDFIWLNKKFKFMQDDYIVFKTDSMTDVEKLEDDVKYAKVDIIELKKDVSEHDNLRGFDATKLTQAVEELIKSNIQTQELLKYINKDLESIKRKLQ